MATWKVNPQSAQGNLTGKVTYGDNLNDYSYSVTQWNTDDILEQVKRDKEDLLNPQRKQLGWRKAFTVPDVIALKMWEDHGFDIHDPLFMHDPENMKKLKYVIRTEYPYLLIST